MSIATLSIDVEARISRLEEGLDKAARINKATADKFSATWAQAGASLQNALAPFTAALSTAAIAQWARANLAAVDSLNDIADASGATVENISALQDIARRTGTEVGVVDTALIKLNQALNSAKPDSDQARALQAIGLSVKELKALDPAEALRQVAAALATYANDGDKARLTQELLGKSARELAPFLKDLGEAGQLNATITVTQAAEAEKLVKAVANMQAAWARMSQSLVADTAPALTKVLLLLQAMRSGPGLLAGVGEVFKGNIFSTEQEAFNKYLADLKTIDADIAGARQRLAKGFNVTDKDYLADLEQKRTKTAQFLDTYRQVLNAGNAGAGRGSINPGATPALRVGDFSAPDKAGSSKAARPDELDAYIKRLQSATVAALDLSEVQRVELAQSQGLFAGRADKDIQALRDLAAGLDALKIKTEIPTVEIPPEVVERARRVQALIGNTQQGKLNAITKDYGALEQEFRRGAVSADQYLATLDQLDAQFAELQPTIAKAGEKMAKMSEFALQAQRNIQDSLGSSLKSLLRGDFDDIGAMWSNLLLDMAAQAAATRLNDYLFGKDGVGTNLLNTVFGFFGLANGGAFDAGVQFYATGDIFNKPTGFAHAGGLGVLGEAGPEAVMPLHRGVDGMLGVRMRGAAQPSVTVVNNLTINGNASPEQVLAIMRASEAQTLRSIADMQRRGNPLLA